MSVETLLDGPSLSWSRSSSGSCILDLLSSAVRAGIPLGPDVGAALKWDWSSLARMLPEGSDERAALKQRCYAHLNWMCKLPDSGLPCAEKRGDADRFIHDAVKAHEDATGIAVTAIATGNAYEPLQAKDSLSVRDLSLERLMGYVTQVDETECGRVSGWALSNPPESDEGAIFQFYFEYTDTTIEEDYVHEVLLFPLNAEQEHIFQQWAQVSPLWPEDVQALACSKPEDYPVLRAIGNYVLVHPSTRHHKTAKDVQQHLANLTATQQEVFLTLLTGWETSLEELAQHSIVIAA